MSSTKDLKHSPSKEYRFFLYDPSDGLTFWRTEEERDKAAETVIGSYLDSIDDGWSDDVTEVFAGTVTHKTMETDIKKRVGDLDEEGCDENGEYWPDDFTHQCNYVLRPIQLPETPDEFATPPAPPLESRGCPLPGACACPTRPIVPPELIQALVWSEAALADIGDAEREPGDDLVWAERRAAEELPRIRRALQRWRDHATPPAATGEAGPLLQAGPTDEQLLELMPQQFRDDLATVSRLASHGTPVGPGIYRVSLNTGALAFARAVLARWGGAAVQPVPVSERPWERPGWLDKNGRCWFGTTHDCAIHAVWSMRRPIQRISHQRLCAPHWALPVPADDEGEVQP